MSKQKFLLDENVSNKTLQRLKRRNLEIYSSKTYNLFGKENGELLAFCSKNKFCLITFDRDFLQTVVKNHWGIIVCLVHPIKDEIAGSVIENFLLNIPSDLKDKTIILEKNNWRYKV